MNTPAQKRVLLVDDNIVVRRAIVRALERTFDVTEASDGLEAITLLEKNCFDAIVTDLEMPRMSGSELVTWLETHQPMMACRVLVLTGGAKRPSEIEWLRSFDRARVLSKPATANILIHAIRAISNRGIA